MFRYQTKVRLEHTDATGFLYFPKQFTLALEAFDEMLSFYKLNIQNLLYNSDISYPVVHAVSDYSSPLRAGDRITFLISTNKIGNSSFELLYTIMDNEREKEAGRVQITQVAIEIKTRNPVTLPEEIRNILDKQRS